MENRLFNKDALFGKKDESPRPETRSVNVTPDLHPGAPARQPAPADGFRLEKVHAEQPKGPAASEEPAGSKLIVGPDIKLKGVEITDCDTLVVEGRVEASMDSRVVQIAQNGVFTGTATMDVAEIWGAFQGQLTVRKHLVVYGTGRVSGNIRYGQIRIEDGGELTGEVSTLAAAQPAPRRAETAAAPAPAAAAPATAASAPLRGSPSGPASPAPARPGAAASR
jgi:cytoskeletal protein CcmA (bactofilin family)